MAPELCYTVILTVTDIKFRHFVIDFPTVKLLCTGSDDPRYTHCRTHKAGC